MTNRLDSEVAAALAELAAAGPTDAAAPGDWRTLRETGNAGLAFLASITPPADGVVRTAFDTETPDGAVIELRWYEPRDRVSGPAVLYAHGGGMILGGLDVYDALLDWYAATSGVPFLSVDYRLAPESQGRSLAEDVYTALEWLRRNAEELGVDAERIAVMGDSGGAAPAAGTAILARDRGLPLAAQLLVHPMLDDRNTDPDPSLAETAPWSYDDNWTAWAAVLGDLRGDEVPSVVAPARLEDAQGLAPAYIEVGDLDIFRDESIAYAGKLASAGVPVELHVHRGVPHGFDRLAPHAEVSQRAFADRVRLLKGL
jgi:acetyl esterase/lipase